MRRARAWFAVVRCIGYARRFLDRLERVCQRRGASAQLHALNDNVEALAARIAAKRGRR